MRRSNCIDGDIPDTEGNVALMLFVSNSKGMKGFDQDDGRRAGGFAGGLERGDGEDAGGESEVHQGVRLTEVMNKKNQRKESREMKVVSYVCREGEDLKFLYVDGDFDSSKFPPCVKELMKSRKGRACCETIITDFGPNAEELFKANGYLLAPKVLWSETEG